MLSCDSLVIRILHIKLSKMNQCLAADKLEACEGQLSHGGRMGRFGSSGKKDASGDQQLHKICCDANKLALEHIKGMSGQVLTSDSFACS